MPSNSQLREQYPNFDHLTDAELEALHETLREIAKLALSYWRQSRAGSNKEPSGSLIEPKG